MEVTGVNPYPKYIGHSSFRDGVWNEIGPIPDPTDRLIMPQYRSPILEFERRKAMETLRMKSDSLPGRTFLEGRNQRCRTRGLVVRIAETLIDLEACLALERHVMGQAGQGPLEEPSAVPFCDFLMAVDISKGVQGVCRLFSRTPDELRHDLPGTSTAARLGARFPASAPLLTAIRYSCQAVLETGSMNIAMEADADTVSAALWHGVAAHMETLGMGYALGRERVSVTIPGDKAAALRRLQESYGIHPDLEARLDSTSRFDWAGVRHPVGPGQAEKSVQDDLDWLSAGLRQGLLKGCRLVGDPLFLPNPGRMEFFWVASREMFTFES